MNTERPTISDATRKVYNEHLEKLGRGHSEAAASLALADAVLVAGDQVVAAVARLEKLLEERNILIQEKVNATR